MDDGAYEERFQQHEEILRSLAAMLASQQTINERMVTFIQEQREFNRQQTEINRQQTEINQDVKTTLARIETLLARMLRHEDNGRDV